MPTASATLAALRAYAWPTATNSRGRVMPENGNRDAYGDQLEHATDSTMSIDMRHVRHFRDSIR